MAFAGDLIADNVIVKGLDYEDGYPLRSYDRCGTIRFSTKEPRTSVTVDPGIVTAASTPVKISFESYEQTAKWAKGCMDLKTETSLDKESGTIKAKFLWNSVGKWEGGTVDHPNALKLNFTNDKKWSLSSRAVKPEWWEQWFLGKTENLPDHWKDISVPGPNVTFSIKALDYFLVMNLLFPGYYTFLAHEPVADSSKKTGLAASRDTILTGNVTTDPKGRVSLLTSQQS